MYEGRSHVAGGHALQCPPARVVLEEAGAGRPDDAHHVGDHGRGRLDPARARPLERDLADRVALEHDGVEGPFGRRERMVAIDEGGADADVDAPVDQRRRTHEPHHRVGRTRRGDVLGGDLLDPAIVDVVERDPRPEGDGREDRHLRGGVRAGDVLGRIGLGVAPAPARP